MIRRLYIQTEAETANLAELLLQEIRALRKDITCLKASVKQLSTSVPYQMLSEEETASLLNISKNTLVTLRTDHEINFHKIKSRILYSVEDIREFEEKCKKI